MSFPNRLRFLFTNSRYKITHGGRGGTKSWGIARALLLLGSNRPLRILCAREVQKSLKQSVHQLLKDQIELLGLEEFYETLEGEIRGKNGTLFLFTGLLEHTASTIKSYEGIDIAWIEEAQTVTKRSCEILIPTIRKEGSEIWMSLNPHLDTDYVYQNFVLNPRPDSQIVQITYKDNPWFPQTLELERQHDQNTKPKEEYENIWLGEPLVAVPGAIYAREVLTLIKEGRYTFCPYDPTLKVHTVWDMGFNDACAIGFVQRRLSELRIIRYMESSLLRIDEWAVELNKLPYNWGWDHLPFDGYNVNRQTGVSDADMLRKHRRRVRPQHLSIPRHDPEVGIRQAKMMLSQVFIAKDPPDSDSLGTARLMECLKRYKRNIPKSTNEPAAPVHDEYSHGADMMRHLAMVAPKLTNDDDLPPIVGRPYAVADQALGVLG